MADHPINPDREQQRRDNVVSRRQSGLEPMPRDRDEARAVEGDEEHAADRQRSGVGDEGDRGEGAGSTGSGGG